MNEKEDVSLKITSFAFSQRRSHPSFTFLKGNRKKKDQKPRMMGLLPWAENS